MKSFDTVTEAVGDLLKRGYSSQFVIEAGCLLCRNERIRLKPGEFDIDEVYRFEGDTDPADETIVFAISSSDKSIKGTLVNAYGAYSDAGSAELVSKLNLKRN